MAAARSRTRTLQAHTAPTPFYSHDAGMVVWMRNVPIGVGMWMLGPQVMVLLGECQQVRPCWSGLASYGGRLWMLNPSTISSSLSVLPCCFGTCELSASTFCHHGRLLASGTVTQSKLFSGKMLLVRISPHGNLSTLPKGKHYPDTKYHDLESSFFPWVSEIITQHVFFCTWALKRINWPYGMYFRF